MGPHIEWEVKDETGRETIARTPPPGPPARWRKIAITLMIFLGIGLGVVYHSIPEPPSVAAPTPLPRPSPTAAPPAPPIITAIQREAQSLAQGDVDTFLSMQDPNNNAWSEAQINAFTAWGTPATGPAYQIIQAMQSADRGWADVAQYRNGRYFRETRFYRLAYDVWVRTAPDETDLTAWGDTQTARTDHFDLFFHARDADAAKFIAAQFEQTYTRICDDLKCDAAASSPDQRLSLSFLPQADRAGFRSRGFQQPITITLPSPSIMGLYFQSLDDLDHPLPDQVINTQSATRNGPADFATQGGPGFPYSASTAITVTLDQFSSNILSALVIQRLTGDPNRSYRAPTGRMFTQAIAQWERLRLSSTEAITASLLSQPALLASPSLPDPESLWTGSFGYTQTARLQIRVESGALIEFMDQKYGAGTVVSFLHVLNSAQSLPEAIADIGLPYDTFKQNWQAWLKQFTGDGS